MSSTTEDCGVPSNHDRSIDLDDDSCPTAARLLMLFPSVFPVFCGSNVNMSPVGRLPDPVGPKHMACSRRTSSGTAVLVRHIYQGLVYSLPKKRFLDDTQASWVMKLTTYGRCRCPNSVLWLPRCTFLLDKRRPRQSGLPHESQSTHIRRKIPRVSAIKRVSLFSILIPSRGLKWYPVNQNALCWLMPERPATLGGVLMGKWRK